MQNKLSKFPYEINIVLICCVDLTKNIKSKYFENLRYYQFCLIKMHQYDTIQERTAIIPTPQ